MKKKRLGNRTEHVFEPLRSVLHPHADEVDGDPRGRDQEAHSDLHRPHVEGHEHQERTDEEKNDGDGDVHLKNEPCSLSRYAKKNKKL